MTAKAFESADGIGVRAVSASAHDARIANSAEAGLQLSAIWIYVPGEPGAADTLRSYARALSSLGVCYELIVVVNGGTADRQDQLVERFEAQNVPCRVVALHRQCDESTSFSSGIEASHGGVLVLFPTYLQTDPSALAEMLARIQRGADMVTSWRHPRVDSRWNAFKSYAFNAVTRRLTGIPLHDLNSGFRVFRRAVAEQVPVYGDLHRFWPILATLHGFRVEEIKTRHLEERVNKGDYRFGVYSRRLLDLLTLFFLFKFTKKPLRFFGLIGSTTLASGVLLLLAITIQRWYGVGMTGRPALLLGTLLVVLGVQLFSLGLLGELIIFTHGRHLRKQHFERVYQRQEDS